MFRPWFHWSLVAIAWLYATLVSPVMAASFTVSPVRIELPPDGTPTIIRVKNGEDAATLVQVVAFPWTDDLDSSQRTSEILAVPPVFELLPRGEQILRLAVREPLEGPTERAYRLVIAEVPRQIAGDAVTFAVRLDLPLFVAPEGAAPAPVWTLRDAPDGATELVLRNEGQAHLRVSKLTLHEPGGMGPFFTTDQAATALPGKEHRWLLEHPAYALPPRLEVRAETQRGELVMPLTHVRD